MLAKEALAKEASSFAERPRRELLISPARRGRFGPRHRNAQLVGTPSVGMLQLVNQKCAIDAKRLGSACLIATLLSLPAFSSRGSVSGGGVVPRRTLAHLESLLRRLRLGKVGGHTWLQLLQIAA
jgi:hypothetical protein